MYLHVIQLGHYQDADIGLTFVGVTLYDGQGFMVSVPWNQFCE